MPKSNRNDDRGFAAMDNEQQMEMASEGGKMSHGDARKGSMERDDNSRAGTSRSGGKQGFASMDREKQREIASMGGKASHGGGRKKKNS